MGMSIKLRMLGGLLAGLLVWGPLQAREPLPALNLDLEQTTVSGISSGAFMAVQFGVAHSAAVRGVAATAGGPYFCAGRDAWAGAGVSRAMARCMQGDPAYPARSIGPEEQDAMVAATRAWAANGLIDASSGLARQRLWIFHGYNDGIVKAPVSTALADYYRHFLAPGQLFAKEELPAAHAQISASCPAHPGGTACNTCSSTGGNYINSCPAAPGSEQAYDAAGSALQFFYGPLERRPTPALGGQVLAFDQAPYVHKGGTPVDPIKVSLAGTGYLYLPADCRAGLPCRLHVAFHGCQQQAEKIGMDFVQGAGFNEWADANRIVVLYPQTAATSAVPITPFNPQGCWDWWGYNDFAFDMTGRYATKEGLQIAAVWRMVQALAAGQGGAPAPAPAKTALTLVDAGATQVLLAWGRAAAGERYRLYRQGADGAAEQRLTPEDYSDTAFVDGNLAPAGSYRYRLQILGADGQLRPGGELEARTAAAPPACDPYFSFSQGRPVTRDNRPSTQVCP